MTKKGPRPQSTAAKLGAQFDALVIKLSREGNDVDQMADNPEVRTLFLKFKNPKAIIREKLKDRIREGIRKDNDPKTGEHNQVSIPALPFALASSPRDEKQHYEVAAEVDDKTKMLLSLEATCKSIRGHINKNKLFFANEKDAILAGVNQAEELFRLRLA